MDRKEIVESYLRIARIEKILYWVFFIICLVLFLGALLILDKAGYMRGIKDGTAKCIIYFILIGAYVSSKLIVFMLIARPWHLKKEKEWDQRWETVETLVSTREKEKRKDGRKRFKSKSLRYVLPYLRFVCDMNKFARKEQEFFLSEYYYTDQIIPMVFERDYTDVQRNEALQYWLKKELADRKALVETLFKLTVVEDGIRNNEWNLLMQIMGQLKFNQYYIDYFKKRYASLRTEFDEYQRSSSSSTNYSASYLKPYYAVLGLQEGATDEEIKRAYHELALQHHPDLPKNAVRIEECEAMMARVNEAYEKVMG